MESRDPQRSSSSRTPISSDWAAGLSKIKPIPIEQTGPPLILRDEGQNWEDGRSKRNANISASAHPVDLGFKAMNCEPFTAFQMSTAKGPSSPPRKTFFQPLPPAPAPPQFSIVPNPPPTSMPQVTAAQKNDKTAVPPKKKNNEKRNKMISAQSLPVAAGPPQFSIVPNPPPTSLPPAAIAQKSQVPPKKKNLKEKRNKITSAPFFPSFPPHVTVISNPFLPTSLQQTVPPKYEMPTAPYWKIDCNENPNRMYIPSFRPAGETPARNPFKAQEFDEPFDLPLKRLQISSDGIQNDGEPLARPPPGFEPNSSSQEEDKTKDKKYQLSDDNYLTRPPLPIFGRVINCVDLEDALLVRGNVEDVIELLNPNDGNVPSAVGGSSSERNSKTSNDGADSVSGSDSSSEFSDLGPIEVVKWPREMTNGHNKPIALHHDSISEFTPQVRNFFEGTLNNLKLKAANSPVQPLFSCQIEAQQLQMRQPPIVTSGQADPKDGKVAKTRKPRKKTKKPQQEPKDEPQDPTQPKQINRKNRKKKTKKKSKSKPEPFSEYMNEDEVAKGLEDGTLIEGELRITHGGKSTEAYVTDPKSDEDILISGLVDRNRALANDIVAIKIHDKSKWKTQQNGALRPTGQVVSVLHDMNPRVGVGFLHKAPDEFAKTHVLLYPRDIKVPKILVPKSSLPIGFDENTTNLLFKAKYTSWNMTTYAEGVIEDVVGPPGEITTETLAALNELDLDHEPVPEYLHQYLPEIPFKITDDEIKSRLDLRNEVIVTIDPESARDLDDAVSAKVIGENRMEIGVHISDVSFFLTADTPLDDFVSQRATTIYLVERAIHMLPLSLCLQCSLLPGQDRLAISVIWTTDFEGNVLETKFARSVINSCAKLSYEDAQNVIDDKPRSLPIVNNVDPNKVEETIRILHRVSQNMIKKKSITGTLKIDQPKVFFKLNNDGIPIAAGVYRITESHRLIEQFMLLANVSVAERLHKIHPEIALLRRHPPPKMRPLKAIKRLLGAIDIHLDLTSAGSLHTTLQAAISKNPEWSIVLSALTLRSMTRAEYFCNAEDTHHYALNFDLYTHFTSPIRRYCDIVVHRLLVATLGYTQLPNWTTNDVKQYARRSNKMKLAAKKAGTASSELYAALFVRSQGGLDVDAVVIHVFNRSFEAIVESLALNVRVNLSEVEGIDVVFQSPKNEDDQLNSTLFVSKPRKRQIAIKVFFLVNLRLTVPEGKLTVEASLNFPA